MSILLVPQLPLFDSHEAWIEAGKPSNYGWRGIYGPAIPFEAIQTQLTPWEQAQWDALGEALEALESVETEEAA